MVSHVPAYMRMDAYEGKDTYVSKIVYKHKDAHDWISVKHPVFDVSGDFPFE